MRLLFDWDPDKAASNERKHNVSFEEAATIFYDGSALTAYDEVHSERGEDRFVTTGISARGRLLLVVHCDEGRIMRIVSARSPTPRETEAYVKSRG